MAVAAVAGGGAARASGCLQPLLCGRADECAHPARMGTFTLDLATRLSCRTFRDRHAASTFNRLRKICSSKSTDRARALRCQAGVSLGRMVAYMSWARAARRALARPMGRAGGWPVPATTVTVAGGRFSSVGGVTPVATDGRTDG